MSKDEEWSMPKHTNSSYRNHYHKSKGGKGGKEGAHSIDFSHNYGRDTFKASLTCFRDYCEDRTNKMVNIFIICNDFSFQRRRFYDVINVLETVGVVHKINTENMYWNGLNKNSVKEHIIKICKNPSINAFCRERTISQILSGEGSSSEPEDEKEAIHKDGLIVGICNITKYFLASFVALKKKTIDVKELSYVLTRDDKTRQKTMLCKLYLVGNILESVGILYKRGVKTSEFTFSDDYFVNILDESVAFNSFDLSSNPLSLFSLLSRIPKQKHLEFIQRRRDEFTQMVKEWSISAKSEKFV